MLGIFRVTRGRSYFCQVEKLGPRVKRLLKKDIFEVSFFVNINYTKYQEN